MDLESWGEGVEIGMASVVLARSATCLFSQCLLLELIVAYLHCCLVPPCLYQSSVYQCLDSGNKVFSRLQTEP